MLFVSLFACHVFLFICIQKDLLHPQASLHWEHCHTWKYVAPTQCAVLQDTIIILDGYGRLLHISTDLHSWTTTRAPYEYSSLTTYQSKFVLVGGCHPSTGKPTNSLLTSTTGVDWKPSLHAMPTRRYGASSVSGGSPEVLVVAGGWDSHYKWLDVVEVLLNDHWTTADSLPSSCSDMQSTFHEGNFYFTGGYLKREILFICTLESLIASASNGRTTPLTIWRRVTTPTLTEAIASSLSNLISMDEHSKVRIYSNKTEKWIETTSEGDGPGQKYTGGYIATAVLSTGQLLVAIQDGVYKGTLSGQCMQIAASLQKKV